MNILFYIIVVIGVFVSSCSQILLKKSAVEGHRNLFKEYLNWKVISSYSLFLIVTFVNVIALKYGVKLKDMPILESFGYVFVPILSFFLLSEKLNIRKVIAIFLILIGIFIFYQ